MLQNRPHSQFASQFGQYNFAMPLISNSAKNSNNSSSSPLPSTSINIFIPTHLFSVIGQGTRAGLLFGYKQQQSSKTFTSSSSVNYNITALIPHNEDHLQQLIDQRLAIIKFENKETNSSDSEECGDDHLRFSKDNIPTSSQILFLGELVDVSPSSSSSSFSSSSSSTENENIKDDAEQKPSSVLKDARYREQVEKLKRLWPQFQLVLSFDSANWPKLSSKLERDVSLDDRHLPYSAIRLISLNLGYFPKDGSNKAVSPLTQTERLSNEDFSQVTLLYYDTRNFMSSQLLNRVTSEDQRVDFLEFINESLKSTAQLVTTSSSNLSPLSASSAVAKAKNLSKSKEETSSNQKTSKLFSKSNMKKNCCSNSWNDPTVSSLMLLLMPRSLIRAFLYFASTPKLTGSAKHLGNSQHFPKTIHEDREAAFQWLFSPFTSISERVPLLARSATVTQLKFRLLQLAICWRLLRREIPAGRRSISLSLGNALSSVFVDVLLGVATIVALHYYSTPQYWLQRAWQYADSMVDDVDRLLRVLQSMPAGLKLNRPLNLALSQFYLYHIYLWESYMDIIRPVFGLVMQAIFYLGIFGFTCILSLLSDIFSLVTIHIYCFYGYGCQLYGLQVSGISALWRLFRGKKYNQLRNRVDSYSYDNEQLFIGTILFTVLLFLLPTVFMYYLVFLVLRFLTLAVQEGLFFFIEHISSMPLYTLILWLLNSRTISGQVYLEVVDTFSSTLNDKVDINNQDDHQHQRRLQHRRQSNRAQRTGPGSRMKMNNSSTAPSNLSTPSPPPPSPMIVRLQTKRVSLLSIITSRYDDVLQSLHAYRLSSSAKQLTWNEFFQSILSGRLLHQNLSIGLSLLLFIGYLLLIVYFALNSVST